MYPAETAKVMPPPAERVSVQPGKGSFTVLIIIEGLSITVFT
jgi:hypothetical protein